MSNINVVAVSGNMTRGIELRETKNGTPVGNTAVAINRSRKDETAEGGYREEVTFLDLTIWGNYAELCARKLKKGDSISVNGRLEQQNWESDSGEKRSKIVVIVDQIDSEGFFRSKDEDNAPGASPAEAAPAQAAAAPAAAPDDEIPF